MYKFLVSLAVMLCMIVGGGYQSDPDLCRVEYASVDVQATDTMLLPLDGHCLLTAIVARPASAADETAPAAVADRESSGQDLLTPGQWKKLDRATDRALAWLAVRQQADGSFPTKPTGQPAVTALCVLAFMSRGHLPGEGLYGTAIERGIDFVLRCQHPDGLLALKYPHTRKASHNSSHTALYNHGIAGLLLSEAYGMTHGDTNRRIRKAVVSALTYTRKTQNLLKDEKYPKLKGGWRYINPDDYLTSDLSVTSWQLMFMRASKNAGFEVPVQCVDRALVFVRNCYDSNKGKFWYAPYARYPTRAMIAAGILSLSLGGQHREEMALRAGEFLLTDPFNHFDIHHDGSGRRRERYFYDAFYSSQAMFQLGGKYWESFYPVLLKTTLSAQRPDGSWPPEFGRDALFGNVYSTAMAVLALTTPYQLLPIFQR